MVVTDLDSVYMPRGNKSAIQVAVITGEVHDLDNPQPPVNTYDISVIEPFYPGETQKDRLIKITNALMDVAKTDVFDSNTNDIASRKNLGESPLTDGADLRARYFATLDIDYRSLKTKSPESTKIKDKVVGWIAKTLGSEVTVNLPETKVQALGTVRVYKRQEPQQPTTL